MHTPTHQIREDFVREARQVPHDIGYAKNRAYAENTGGPESSPAIEREKWQSPANAQVVEDRDEGQHGPRGQRISQLRGEKTSPHPRSRHEKMAIREGVWSPHFVFESLEVFEVEDVTVFLLHGEYTIFRRTTCILVSCARPAALQQLHVATQEL